MTHRELRLTSSYLAPCPSPATVFRNTPQERVRWAQGQSYVLHCSVPVYVAGSEEGRCTSTLPAGAATIREKDRAQVGTACLVWVFEHTIDDTG